MGESHAPVWGVTMDRNRTAFDLVRAADRPFPVAEVEVQPVDIGTVARLPDAIQYTKTRVFVPSPKVLESNRILAIGESQPAAAAVRMLRTQILLRLEENQWRSVAILSVGADEGKTTTAINLAINLATDNRHTVLLVDFDLRRPAIANRLGFTPDKGVDDYLRGQASVEECLYHPEGFDRLVVLPARGPMENSAMALASPRGRALVSELRNRYPDRIILFDLPPIKGADDALAFASMVQCGLIVVAEGTTRRQDLLRCMELFRRIPIIGTVLNRATHTASAYG